MIYYGKGFTFSDVYTMPIYLRKFYHKTLADTLKNEQEEYDKAMKRQNQKLKR